MTRRCPSTASIGRSISPSTQAAYVSQPQADSGAASGHGAARARHKRPEAQPGRNALYFVAGSHRRGRTEATLHFVRDPKSERVASFGQDLQLWAEDA